MSPPSRERLPEGTRVRIVRSTHKFLVPGMEGTIHWNHATAVSPTFRSDGWGTTAGGVSVQLLGGRDKIEKLCGRVLTVAHRGRYVTCDRPAGHEEPCGWRKYVQPPGVDHPAMEAGRRTI